MFTIGDRLRSFILRTLANQILFFFYFHVVYIYK